MSQQIRLRRGTTAQWTAANTVLTMGEPGVDIDTGAIKIGDGVTPWLSLDVALGGGGGGISAGTLSARPTAVAAGANALYLANDVGAGAIYMSNGSTWALISPVGPTQYRMSAKMLDKVEGSPALVTTGVGSSYRWTALAMDPAVAEAVAETFRPPLDWTTCNIDLEWTNTAVSAGDVVWRADTTSAGNGDLLQGGITNAPQVTVAAPAQYEMKITRLASNVALTPGETFYLRIMRIATDAADTLANDAAILGAVLTKVS